MTTSLSLPLQLLKGGITYLMIMMMMLTTISTTTKFTTTCCHAWTPALPPLPKSNVKSQTMSQQTTATTTSRRDWLQRQSVAVATAFLTTSIGSPIMTPTSPVFAATAAVAAATKTDEPVILYDPVEVQKAFDGIRYELENPNGGVALLQTAVDRKDCDTILDFTKTYDLELRKAKMLTAKKKFKLTATNNNSSNSADADTDPQQILNNVTFDLIGMNKSCRPGRQQQQQDNMQTTQTYLNELKDDIRKFLNLQTNIPVTKKE